MHRAQIKRVPVFVAIVALLVTSLGFLGGAQVADAEDLRPASVALGNYEIEMSGDSLSAELTIDPGSGEVNGIQGFLRFDPSQLEYLSCTTAGLGLCHSSSDGEVAFAVIDTYSFQAAAPTVSFEFDTSQLSSSVVLDLEIVEIVDSVGSITEFAAASGSVTYQGALGSIAGAVVDIDSGMPLGGIDVCADDSYDAQVAAVCTVSDVDGQYRIDGLNTGTYNVLFADRDAVHAPTSAIDVAVTPPAVTANIHAAMVGSGGTSPLDVIAAEDMLPGSISGVISDPSGGAVLGAQVCVSTTCVITKLDGSYTVDNVMPGTHLLKATDPGVRFGAANSVAVTVEAGQDVVDVHVSLRPR